MALKLAAPEFLLPDWDVPSNVKALCTTRAGGASRGGYASFNLADHVADDPAIVEINRQHLLSAASLPEAPRWLSQVHGSEVVNAAQVSAPVAADSSWTRLPGTVCAILTADCLPVLFTDTEGRMVAAAHAGWRGLVAGVLARTVAQFTQQQLPAESLRVWLGPAIGPAEYEVDTPVWQSLTALNPDCAGCFSSTRPGHWKLDLYGVARVLLEQLGVRNIAGGGLCTLSDERFYSYRETPVCGRQATLIWLAD